MPPKKAKKGKGGKQKAEKLPLDDIDTSVLTREKLEEFCVDVYQALTKERQYSDFLRLERDKLTNLVAVAREQLSRGRHAVRTRDCELREAEDSHRHEMALTRQQLINLQSEKDTDCLDTKLESARVVSLEEAGHQLRMSEIIRDIKLLEDQSSELRQLFFNESIALQTKHAKNVSELRQKDEELHILTENNRDKNVSILEKLLNRSFDEELTALEKRKTNEVVRAVQSNAKFIHDLKHYYNKIVHHNLSVMLTMKATCQELKSETAVMDNQVSRLKEENDQLTSSLQQSVSEEEELQEKLSSSKRDKNELRYTKHELEENRQTADLMKWELEALNLRLDKHQAAMDEAAAEESKSLFALKTRAEECTLVLEHMVTHLYHKSREADSLLSKVRGIYRARGQELDGVGDFHDTSLDELNYQLTTVLRQRAEVLRTYHRLLDRHCIHQDNTGFEPHGGDHIVNTARNLRVLVNADELMM